MSYEFHFSQKKTVYHNFIIMALKWLNVVKHHQYRTNEDLDESVRIIMYFYFNTEADL